MRFPEQGRVIHSPRRFDLFSLTVTIGRKLNGELPHGAKRALFSAPMRGHGICMSGRLLALILSLISVISPPHRRSAFSAFILSLPCLLPRFCPRITFRPSVPHIPYFFFSPPSNVGSALFLCISSLQSDSCLPFSLFPIPSSSSSSPPLCILADD